MSGHCEDIHKDRNLGAFWEKKFGGMAREYGHVFTPHQFGHGTRSASAWSKSGHLVLPDFTIWSGPGEHHEIKHKNPTGDHCFGLEVYRLDHLLEFAATTLEPVYYTIHNWQLAGGRDVTVNRMEDWVTCDVGFLHLNRGIPRWGSSYVKGEKKNVPILYWAAAYFRPLATLWRRQPTRARMTYERQEAAIDSIGNAEFEAERADHAGLFGDEE